MIESDLYKQVNNPFLSDESGKGKNNGNGGYK